MTDPPSRVLTFDLRTSPPTTVSEVTTKAGEPTRADELAYDPRDGLLLVVNNASDPPFGTLIQVNKTTGALTVVKNIPFDAAHGVDATNGAEQPAWDPGTGKFYLSIPQIGPTASHGGVLRISTSGTVEATLSGRVLLACRSRPRPQAGPARRLQHGLRYGGWGLDWECG